MPIESEKLWFQIIKLFSELWEIYCPKGWQNLLRWMLSSLFTQKRLWKNDFSRQCFKKNKLNPANSLEFVNVSDNWLHKCSDHILQFFVLKDLRVSYRPKDEQILKHNYTFFSNNALKNEINQIDCKTLFDNHDMNLCFVEILNILTCVFDAPIKKFSEK